MRSEQLNTTGGIQEKTVNKLYTDSLINEKIKNIKNEVQILTNNKIELLEAFEEKKIENSKEASLLKRRIKSLKFKIDNLNKAIVPYTKILEKAAKDGKVFSTYLKKNNWRFEVEGVGESERTCCKFVTGTIPNLLQSIIPDIVDRTLTNSQSSFRYSEDPYVEGKIDVTPEAFTHFAVQMSIHKYVEDEPEEEEEEEESETEESEDELSDISSDDETEEEIPNNLTDGKFTYISGNMNQTEESDEPLKMTIPPHKLKSGVKRVSYEGIEYFRRSFHFPLLTNESTALEIWKYQLNNKQRKEIKNNFEKAYLDEYRKEKSFSSSFSPYVYNFMNALCNFDTVHLNNYKTKRHGKFIRPTEEKLNYYEKLLKIEKVKNINKRKRERLEKAKSERQRRRIQQRFEKKINKQKDFKINKELFENEDHPQHYNELKTFSAKYDKKHRELQLKEAKRKFKKVREREDFTIVLSKEQVKRRLLKTLKIE